MHKKQSKKTPKHILGLVLILLFSIAPIVDAQTASATPAVCTNPSSADIAQACADYAAENKVLAQLQTQLTQQKNKSGSLQKNVNALVSQITNTQSKISGEINTINSLSLQITQKQRAVGDLNAQLDRENASMAQLHHSH